MFVCESQSEERLGAMDMTKMMETMHILKTKADGEKHGDTVHDLT